MPRGDKTGPFGAGPMTGRGAGYCAGFDVPGFANNDFLTRGRGGGFGGGRGGRGWRNRNWQPAGGRGMGWGYWNTYGQSAMTPPVDPTPQSESELDYLKRQSKHLQQSLQRLQGKIDELEGTRD